MKTFLALVLVLFLADTTQAAPVHVARVSYHGWTGAYRLTNGVVDVIVLPRIGRVMAFSFTGQPQTSPIYNNPAEFGQPAPPAVPYPKVWTNFGGDKVWPSEQSQWPKHQPLAWPPDPSFDSGPYRLTRLPNGVRLTGPVSPYYQIRVIRDITLTPHRAQVTLRETFIKARNATGKQNGFPVGIWTITQTRGEETVFLPVTRRGHFPVTGFNDFASGGSKPPPLLVPTNGLLRITRDPKMSTKRGSDAPAGWLASLYDGNVLFSEHFRRLPHALYPDLGCSAEVYTNPGTATPYIEMELLGPMKSLRAGQRITWTTHWRLQRLPRVPKDAADARRLVAARMQR